MTDSEMTRVTNENIVSWKYQLAVGTTANFYAKLRRFAKNITVKLEIENKGRKTAEMRCCHIDVKSFS